MSTIADQLAGALRLFVDAERGHDWRGLVSDSAEWLAIHAADQALSAYEASRHAPAVREVTEKDVKLGLSAFDKTGNKPTVGTAQDGIRAALNSFRDRLNGEAS